MRLRRFASLGRLHLDGAAESGAVSPIAANPTNPSRVAWCEPGTIDVTATATSSNTVSTAVATVQLAQAGLVPYPVGTHEERAVRRRGTGGPASRGCHCGVQCQLPRHGTAVHAGGHGDHRRRENLATGAGTEEGLGDHLRGLPPKRLGAQCSGQPARLSKVHC